MSIFAIKPEEDAFKASIQLTTADLTGYLTRAAEKRGVTGVTVKFGIRFAGSGRWGEQRTVATICGTKNGQTETEECGSEEVAKIIKGELEADGHIVTFFQSVSYDERERKASGVVWIAVPRKISR